MEIMYERVAGIDVHKRQITVTVRTPGARPGKRREQVRRYATFYAALREMTAWLIGEAVTHVAMESTGVYWKPVFHALIEPGGLEIDLRVFEGLLQPLLLPGLLAHQAAPVAGHIPQLADRLGVYQARPAHPPLDDLGQPDRVEPVGLRPAHPRQPRRPGPGPHRQGQGEGPPPRVAAARPPPGRVLLACRSRETVDQVGRNRYGRHPDHRALRQARRRGHL
jgi:hypothetical protein